MLAPLHLRQLRRLRAHKQAWKFCAARQQNCCRRVFFRKGHAAHSNTIASALPGCMSLSASGSQAQDRFSTLMFHYKWFAICACAMTIKSYFSAGSGAAQQASARAAAGGGGSGRQQREAAGPGAAAAGLCGAVATCVLFPPLSFPVTSFHFISRIRIVLGSDCVTLHGLRWQDVCVSGERARLDEESARSAAAGVTAQSGGSQQRLQTLQQQPAAQHRSRHATVDMVTDCSSTSSRSSSGGNTTYAGNASMSWGADSSVHTPVHLLKPGLRQPNREQQADGAARCLWRPQTAPLTPSLG